MRPAHRHPAGVNEEKYKNGRIVSCGRGKKDLKGMIRAL